MILFNLVTEDLVEIVITSIIAASSLKFTPYTITTFLLSIFATMAKIVNVVDMKRKTDGEYTLPVLYDVTRKYPDVVGYLVEERRTIETPRLAKLKKDLEDIKADPEIKYEFKLSMLGGLQMVVEHF